MKKIALSGKLGKGKFVVVDDAWYDVLNTWTWNLSPEGYATTAFRNPKWLRVYMHRLIMGNPDRQVIDHINGSKIDNRRENLQACTRQQNCRRYGLPRHNISGYRGVQWNKRLQNWVAIIQFNHKSIYLGQYGDKESAAKAYNAASLKYHGEFGFRNPI